MTGSAVPKIGKLRKFTYFSYSLCTVLIEEYIFLDNVDAFCRTIIYHDTEMFESQSSQKIDTLDSLNRATLIKIYFTFGAKITSKITITRSCREF